MNSHFRFQQRMTVLIFSCKALQMIHNRTMTPARLTIELQRLGCAQEISRVLVLQSHGLASNPMLGTTNDFPIISPVPHSITLSKCGHFLLLAKHRLDGMGMQIAFGQLMRQTNHRSALDRFGQLARRYCSRIFTGSSRMIRRSNPPQGVLRCQVTHKGHNLLTTPGIEIFIFGIQKIACIDLLNFDDGTARDGVFAVIAVCCCC